MLKLRTLAECAERAEREYWTYSRLYDQSRHENGELHKKSVYYAGLMALASRRIRFWYNHPPVSR